MRSRATSLALGGVVWIAIGAAAFFFVHTEKQMAGLREAVRAFDLHAREAADALTDLRVGQQAYVAEGQGVAFWMPKVAATGDVISQAVQALRRSAKDAAARSSLDEAADSIVEFGNVDKRARDYIRSDQQLMAGDIIFSEGGETAATAARQVEAARLAERQALDASEAAVRKQQVMALGATGAFAALVVLWLGVSPNAPPLEMAHLNHGPASLDRTHDQPEHAPEPEAGPIDRPVSPMIRDAADLCTDLGRVRDVKDLQMLMGRAAEIIDASGLVVWLGTASGADLRPVLAHGYSPQTLARMPSVPRSGDNAAAAAYRTAKLQIVLARPGSSIGAVVAPIVSNDGCVGALSAEIRSGGEASEIVQALAALFAAQLAAVLTAAPAESDQRSVGGASL